MESLPKLRLLSLLDLPSSPRTWILENFLHEKLIATSLEGLVHKNKIFLQFCHNSGTRGSPDAFKVGPPPVGSPRRRTRQGFKTGRWAPHLPHGNQARTASTTTTKGWGTSRGHPQPGRRRGGPGDPDARQEARLTPGLEPPHGRRG